MIAAIQALWPYLRLYRQHALPLLLGLLLSLFTLAAGIGLLSLSGWFLSACAVAGLTLATRQSFNYLFPAGGVRFLSIMRTAGRWAERVVSHDATFRLLTSLRSRFWQQLLPLPSARLQGFRQADLLNRLVSDIDALDHLYLRLITPLLSALLMLLALFGFLCLFDPSQAAVLTGVLSLLVVLLPLLFYRLGQAPGRALALSRASLRTQLVDYVDNQAELLLCGAEPSWRAKLEADEAHLLTQQRRLASLGGLATGLFQSLLGMVTVLMLWLAADGVGEAPPGPLTALMVFVSLAAFELVLPLANAFTHLSTTLTAARRLNEITAPGERLTYGEHPTPAQTGQLHIRDLAFAYGAAPRVLTDLSLELAPGQKVAILGPTGCGKSTLLSLLTRELTPASGSLTLDGRPLADYSEGALRASMAVVGQRVHLFSATLADNLRLAKPTATDDELLAVLAAVELDRLLPEADPRKALALWLGEGGRQLSGGELRRLELARALLHDAPLLLLDEATEGLDPATEQAILALILRHAQDKSLLMITHRLTGLAQMDSIGLLEDGRLRCLAPHAELLAQDDHYRRLHQQLA
ncbi:cysteine/glutathione ABC transporter ATP-binding protein/permease CydC [Pseudaeromonas paramecii]|uniref:Cysteine/glutathione ABC transporter ATP-binding protein/permease CydC n=1 Tax=Pseudaeromonas paramecii TaxID=2138166 RepID=A0ABP8Q639_9GAMM